jgi:hypothetical protein
MKNKEAIEWLKQFKSDEQTDVTINFTKYALNETTYHTGEWSGKGFSMESYCNWKRGTMKIRPDVEDLIEILSENELSEIDDTNLPDLELHETSDGSIEFGDIEWDEPLTEDEEDELNKHDLYWDSEISDCEYQFGKGEIWSFEIEVNGEKHIIEA